MKRRVVFALVLAMLVISGCTQKPVDPTTKPTEPAATKPVEPIPTSAPTEPADPLEVLRADMMDSSCAFAVAFVGNIYLSGDQDPTALLQENAALLCAEYPFLLEIPSENMVDMGFGEIYCIIPADPDAAVRVAAAEMISDAEKVYEDVLYEASGEPFLLICNGTDLLPDAQVTVVSQGSETVWYPRLDKYLRPEPLIGETGQPLFLDITDYGTLFARDYLEMLDWDSFGVPTREDLVGTVWGWEGFAANDDLFTTYLLAFEENTAIVRWNDGINREDHELRDVPWDLQQMDSFAVLTLDLGGFAGVRSYNLLYAEEYGWLYTIVDLTSLEVAAGQEIPMRIMEERSLDAPDPMEMVGTWQRFRLEVEGYQEEDNSRSRTITIQGETQDALTISFMDRNYPDSNYYDQPLIVKQGVIYYGCGNQLWLAEVDYVGPWGTTYTITLLDDGTLLVHNYFLLDGAPSVSIEWFKRTG